MVAVPVDSPIQESPLEPSLNWERFYQNYRKPGYVPGYEIVHKLGGGVFGIVFKARKESIGKAYAIKFLKVDDPGVKEQVLKELDTVSLFAQVDHPNLVSIEDKGVVDGIPFIIMGYAGEETLKTRLDEGALGEEDALRIFVQIVRGVQALHEHSLIHFDLKPANIFLKGDIARVGDYGLSKLISESRLSLSFGRGTPYYMAPEMLHRRGDHRSDIYSLGVIFYECLCGDVPFRGENEWEVLKGHEEKEVPFPPAIKPEYQRILERMLAKKSEDRYRDLSEVLADLKAPGRLGESIVIEYGGAASRRPKPDGKATRTEAATGEPRAPAREPELAATAQVEVDFEGAGIFGSLLRALVIALLLPAKVLGIGLGRGLQVMVSWPVAILAFLGKVSLIFLVGVVVLLIAAMFALAFGG